MSAVFDQVVNGAGFAILKGPAGIGKTFAVDTLAKAQETSGVNVLRVTATPAIGGSVNAFVRAILTQYQQEAQSTGEGVDMVCDLVSGHPFRPYGSRTLFIVDEAQELKTTILETIRGIWDRGEAARMGDVSAPAFGCALVGNDTFMGKGGAVRTASFRPLLSRLTHNMMLPRPSAAEHRDYAAALFPEDDALQRIIQGFGQDQGSFRAQAIAARQARQMAKGQPVTDKHLVGAIRMMGGRA